MAAPEKITIEKSGVNTAIESYNAEREADIEIRQNSKITESSSVTLGYGQARFSVTALTTLNRSF